jgi:RNA ligase (TIGR02306 family)
VYLDPVTIEIHSLFLEEIPMRKLVTYRIINKISPIPKADYIELAHVDGWQSIVKKGDFKVGDVVLYCEVDSFIPHEVAPFLTKAGKDPEVYKGIKGERLKTMRLYKTLSQGLILPTSLLNRTSNFPLGEDVSGELGVIKYEEEEVQRKLSQPFKKMTGPFPSDFPKTDQERVQNLPFVFQRGIGPEEYQRYRKAHSCTYEVTEKLDGTSCSIRLAKDGKHIEVFSRNYEYLNEGAGSVYGEVATAFNIKNRIRPWRWYDYLKSLLGIGNIGLDLPARIAGYTGLVFQGEIIGPKIQQNRYNLKEPRFFVYDIYDMNHKCYLEPQYVKAICLDTGLLHVPTLYRDFKLGNSTLDDLLQMTDMTSCVSMLDSCQIEGLVFKANTPERFSFKVISNKYLLDHNM